MFLLAMFGPLSCKSRRSTYIYIALTEQQLKYDTIFWQYKQNVYMFVFYMYRYIYMCVCLASESVSWSNESFDSPVLYISPA